ncbi:MAG: phosphatidylglycerophosphatase A family protein [Halothiobacillaceae bacterium]
MTTSPERRDSNPNVAAPGRVLRDPLLFVAFGFGTGLSPRAPGTVGTLAGLPFVLALAPFSPWVALVAVVLFFAAGVWLCDRASEKLGVHDHGGIVWDEIVGLMITFLWVPLSIWTLLAGFLLFRFFDILKPWPIRWLDRHVGGGFGIMIDDVLAGLFALAVLHAGLAVLA